MEAGGRRWTAVGARVAYLAVLALATWSALRLDPDPAAVAERLRRMLVPAVSARDAVDGARNVALFAGWGLVWVLTAPRQSAGRALVGAGLTGAAASLALELVQLLSWTRRASVLDLATNTLGSLVGAAAVILAVRALEARRERPRYTGVPAFAFAAAYGAAVLGEALVPLFRPTVAGAWGGPARRFAAAASQFDWASIRDIPATDFLLFLPAGVFAVAALVEERAGRWRAAAIVAAGGALLFAVVEVAHGVLGQPIVVGAALLHAAAVAAGAALAAGLLPRFTRAWQGADRARVVALGYAATLLLWTFRPYRLELDPSTVARELAGRWWIPLNALAQRVDPFSVVDVLNGFLLYLPLGALLAVWPVRRRGALAGPLPGVYLAVVGELAQLAVAGRTLDVTDMLVQAAGAAVGWLLARRAGYRPRAARV